MNQKKGRSAREWGSYVWNLIRGSLAPTALMALFWLVLGWVRAAGVQCSTAFSGASWSGARAASGGAPIFGRS